MRGAIVIWRTVPREAMPRQDDRMLIVRQHIFDVFAERPARERHGFRRQIVQALSSGPNAGNPTAPRHMKREISGAGTEIPIDIAASERGVGISNGLF